MDNKAPGVYVEEISIFPHSVTEVATAIPAFIGYTEKASYKSENLTGKTKVVSSVIEFEECFGKGSAFNVDKVVLTGRNIVSEVETTSTYLLYDSIRLYFANGGGRCYIVSVGQYGKSPKDEIEKDAILEGLSEIAKEDEPTILLFPDAALLDGTGLYELQKTALKQAADLGDRFVILDLLEKEYADKKGNYEEFRNNIGTKNLAYGAAYTPYLKTTFPNEVKYRNVMDSLFKYGGKVKLVSLTDETQVKDTINALENITTDSIAFQRIIDTIKTTSTTLEEMYQLKIDAFKDVIDNSISSEADIRNTFKDLCTFCYNVLNKVFDSLASGSGPLKGDGTKSLQYILTNKFSSEFSDIAQTLNSYLKNSVHEDLNELYRSFTWDATDWTTVIDRRVRRANTFTWTATTWRKVFESTNVSADDSVYGFGGTTKEKLSNAEQYVSVLSKRLNGIISDLQLAAANLEKELETQILQKIPVYKKIVTTINGYQTIVPPSGAIAGIYCLVDRTRGVWKAPASVSLSNVAGLTAQIDNAEQDYLNVDVNAGKSINPIRMFTGRGILVWGARTLAGNDNEWRYISARRFFNIVEESVIKSTRWAVFEPNDANVWKKIKTMIENYLSLKWRDGALVGAKPDEAFFVNVGLGTTMIPQDILEGRLIVEIGMAVVRPAEFIVLRFMQKMQES